MVDMDMCSWSEASGVVGMAPLCESQSEPRRTLQTMKEKGNIEPSMAERTALLKQQSKKLHC